MLGPKSFSLPTQCCVFRTSTKLASYAPTETQAPARGIRPKTEFFSFCGPIRSISWPPGWLAPWMAISLQRPSTTGQSRWPSPFPTAIQSGPSGRPIHAPLRPSSDRACFSYPSGSSSQPMNSCPSPIDCSSPWARGQASTSAFWWPSSPFRTPSPQVRGHAPRPTWI
ncbi:hypothetical protein ebA2446 [Aromatoleum aromaticum EbN1]|uniref:Uncharacterized protein n=1 Tax=Aromatoleum aromaticum (strain DSM 19018 / LMG 30748 / EbN1) TaxID=76114 RepID=Q5P5B2_AROAE|nr:hypothetical protein ebA2446 [Aromatoleum aromaticum EbN1]